MPRVGLRWKLAAVFAGTLTVLFALATLWVLSFATGIAQDRVVEQLHDTAVGGAAVTDADAFRRLTQLPAVADTSSESGLGYPDDPLYERSARRLLDLRTVVPEASPYTYFRDPTDGRLYFASSYGYFSQPRFGVPFRMPVADVVGESTAALMAAGLDGPTDQPAYDDGYGSWISTYAPIRDGAGEVVGAIGVDYPLEYVRQVRGDVAGRLLVMFAVIYAVLMAVVLVITTGVVRPLKRLNAAARRVADGEYDLDLTALVKTRFPDEMSELSSSFADMATRVAARERSLKTEVERLRVEVDEGRRSAAVSEIVDTDFFAELTGKADALRKRMQADD